MPIVNAKEMLLEATAGKYAVGAFNITNIIQMKAVIAAAVNKRSPLIIQTSVTPSKYLQPEVVAAVCRTLAEAADIPICLHLDHCDDVDYCQVCAEAGYSSIMIDASQHDFDENIRQTREVSRFCHARGISVEGELGTVCGIEDQVVVAEDEAQLCDPEKALEFAERSELDLLAPAIGTAHGVYKTANPVLDFERLAKIAQLVNGQAPRIPLVIHGGTGLSAEVVRKLVALGGAKFNVSTELKHVLIDTTYDYIRSHRDQYNPGKLDLAVSAAITACIERWIELLGSAGKA